MMKNPKLCRNGFTIVELLCTLLIGSLVIGMLCGLLSQICEEDRRIREVHPNETWEQRLRIILEKDVSSADIVLFQKNGLILEGYMPTDVVRNSHSPSRVAYTIQRKSGRPILVRNWLDLAGVAGRNTGSDKLCEGVVRLNGNLSHGVDSPVVDVAITFSDSRKLEFPIVRHGVSN